MNKKNIFAVFHAVRQGINTVSHTVSCRLRRAKGNARQELSLRQQDNHQTVIRPLRYIFNNCLQSLMTDLG